MPCPSVSIVSLNNCRMGGDILLEVSCVYSLIFGPLRHFITKYNRYYYKMQQLIYATKVYYKMCVCVCSFYGLYYSPIEGAGRGS